MSLAVSTQWLHHAGLQADEETAELSNYSMLGFLLTGRYCYSVSRQELNLSLLLSFDVLPSSITFKLHFVHSGRLTQVLSMIGYH